MITRSTFARLNAFQVDNTIKSVLLDIVEQHGLKGFLIYDCVLKNSTSTSSNPERSHLIKEAAAASSLINVDFRVKTGQFARNVSRYYTHKKPRDFMVHSNLATGDDRYLILIVDDHLIMLKFPKLSIRKTISRLFPYMSVQGVTKLLLVAVVVKTPKITTESC